MATYSLSYTMQREIQRLYLHASALGCYDTVRACLLDGNACLTWSYHSDVCISTGIA